ncbi:MAG TPA: hypothetical protein VM784_13160 [Actinomycetota bacterium]|nr:hypothetical protein [Actinomycetota bacterium]
MSRWRTNSAVAAALLVVACTPSEQGPQGDRSHRPRDPGAVTIVVVGDPHTLDPYGSRATFLTQALARPLYRSLFRLGPDGQPEKDLVDDLEVRGRRAVASLVPGPLTARDVVASARRARPPSGFAGLEVRAAGRRRVHLRGADGGWARRLARATWVLPNGRATGNGGGPYRVTEHTPGFEAVLERRGPESSGSSITRVHVRVAPDTPTALRLVGEGRADAGWIPSTVNLEERAVQAGLVHAGAIGWESIVLDFRESPLSPGGRAWVAQGAGRGRLGGGLVRDEGEIASDPVPAGAVRPATVFLAAPAEDELLVLLLRAVQRRLAGRGTQAEAVTIPAGDPFPPGAVRLIRSVGAPGAHTISFPATWPLFRVESSLVWRPGLSGPQPNPTLDGPLWNLEEWRFERPL